MDRGLGSGHARGTLAHAPASVWQVETCCRRAPLLQAQSDLTPEQAASVVALRDGLVDKKDFWAVREVTWNLLKDW